MDTKLATSALVFLLVLFTSVLGDPMRNHGRIVYTRDQLLASRSMSMLTGERPDLPRELKRRK